jgi:hypothetical protein
MVSDARTSSAISATNARMTGQISVTVTVARDRKRLEPTRRCRDARGARGPGARARSPPLRRGRCAPHSEAPGYRPCSVPRARERVDDAARGKRFRGTGRRGHRRRRTWRRHVPTPRAGPSAGCNAPRVCDRLVIATLAPARVRSSQARRWAIATPAPAGSGWFSIRAPLKRSRAVRSAHGGSHGADRLEAHPLARIR